MLDIKFIRENPGFVKKEIKKRGELDNIDEILEFGKLTHWILERIFVEYTRKLTVHRLPGNKDLMLWLSAIPLLPGYIHVHPIKGRQVGTLQDKTRSRALLSCGIHILLYLYSSVLHKPQQDKNAPVRKVVDIWLRSVRHSLLHPVNH